MSEFSLQGQKLPDNSYTALGESLETKLRQPMCSLEDQGDPTCAPELQLGLGVPHPFCCIQKKNSDKELDPDF